MGFNKITATTSSLNLPCLKAYERAGYYQAWKGRKDGSNKPAFVRMEKTYLGLCGHFS